MKKFLIIITIVITMTLSDGYGQNRSIQFTDKPWSEIVAQARKENRLIFLDAYASWCGPCKWMAANIFTNDTVADFFNKTFICSSIDMEKGEGLTLRKQYEVRAYPTLLFIDGEGNMVHKKVGADRNAMDYINMGKTALDPGENLSACMKKYRSGSYGQDFIPKYLYRLADAYMPVQDVLKQYFSTQTENELYEPVNWNIIKRYVIDMDSPEFIFLVKNRKEFSKRYTEDSVDTKISNVYADVMMKMIRDIRMTDSIYNAMKEKIRVSGYEGAEKVFFYSDMYLFQFRGETQKFLELTYEKLLKYYGDDYNMLNNIAWSVQEMTSDKKYLERALTWAKRTVDLKSEPFNNDTVAMILLKMGKKEDAIRYEKEALRLAKEKHQPVREYEESLKNMMQPEN